MLSVRELSGRGRTYSWRSDQAPVRVGRRPDLELAFDLTTETLVSLTHAEFRASTSGWLVADTGSTNGTWVNGTRIEAPRALRPGDRVEFGPGGPVVEVMAVARSGGRRWAWTAAAAVFALVFVGGFVWMASQRRQLETEQLRLQSLVDSLLAAGRAQEQELSAQLEGASRDLASLRADLDGAERVVREARRAEVPDPVELDRLQRELLGANARLERYRLAASIDVDRIERDNENAVARIYARLPDGNAVAGTAFAVGAGGVLVTAGHVVDSAAGGELAVQFAYSTQTWRAATLARSEEFDLALIEVQGLVGDVPTVGALNARADTLGSSQPVALIGFPLGGAPAAEGAPTGVPRPVVLLGVTEATASDRIEFDTYGRPGASGSPVFDETGSVIGVLIGAPATGPAGTAVAAPARGVLDLLAGAGLAPATPSPSSPGEGSR